MVPPNFCDLLPHSIQALTRAYATDTTQLDAFCKKPSRLQLESEFARFVLPVFQPKNRLSEKNKILVTGLSSSSLLYLLYFFENYCQLKKAKIAKNPEKLDANHLKTIQTFFNLQSLFC